MLDLSERNIIYFDPFYFRDGSISKPKYFLVIKDVDSNIILASLPTSQSKLPYHLTPEPGCIYNKDEGISTFCMIAGEEVTECNFSFELNTYIHGYGIQTFEKALLLDLYKIEGGDYEIIGKLKEEIYNELVDCLKSSGIVSRKYRRILGADI